MARKSDGSVVLTLGLDDAIKAIEALTGPRKYEKVTVAEVRPKPKKRGRPKGAKNKPENKPENKPKAAKPRKAAAIKLKAPIASKKVAKKYRAEKSSGAMLAILAFLGEHDGRATLAELAKASGVSGKALGGIIGSHNRWKRFPHIDVATLNGEKVFSIETTTAPAGEPAPSVAFAAEAPAPVVS